MGWGSDYVWAEGGYLNVCWAGGQPMLHPALVFNIDRPLVPTQLTFTRHAPHNPILRTRIHLFPGVPTHLHPLEGYAVRQRLRM